MINIPITFEVETGNGPFSFRFYDSSGQSCVTFSPQEGVTSRGNLVNTVATFYNQDCLDNAVINVEVTDKDGNCRVNQIVPVGNPCADFGPFPVTVGPNYTFCAQTPLGQSFSYNWVWDPTVFSPSGPTDQICIDFNRVNPNATSTTVYVTITDESGCEITQEVVYTFCRPIPISRITTIACNESGTEYVSNTFNLTAEPCPNCNIDWTSIFFNSVPPGLTVETVNAVAGIYRVRGVPTLPVGNYTITYTVSDICGNNSVQGTITVVITEVCGQDFPFIINDTTARLDCEAGLGIGDVFTIDIEPLIVPSGNVDWNSFEFVPCGCTTDTTPQGCTVTWNATTRQVEYTICALSGSDYFEWSICDLDGNCNTASAYVNIILDCSDPPIAADDAACADCGSPVTIDILSNDNPNGGLIDPTSVMITQSALHGTLFVNPNGTVVYTPSFGYSGSDTFKYKVANTNGQFSNEATVTITVLCAGTPSAITVCA